MHNFPSNGILYFSRIVSQDDRNLKFEENEISVWRIFTFRFMFREVVREISQNSTKCKE